MVLGSEPLRPCTGEGDLARGCGGTKEVLGTPGTHRSPWLKQALSRVLWGVQHYSGG